MNFESDHHFSQIPPILSHFPIPNRTQAFPPANVEPDWAEEPPQMARFASPWLGTLDSTLSTRASASRPLRSEQKKKRSAVGDQFGDPVGDFRDVNFRVWKSSF